MTHSGWLLTESSIPSRICRSTTRFQTMCTISSINFMSQNTGMPRIYGRFNSLYPSYRDLIGSLRWCFLISNHFIFYRLNIKLWWWKSICCWYRHFAPSKQIDYSNPMDKSTRKSSGSPSTRSQSIRCSSSSIASKWKCFWAIRSYPGVYGMDLWEGQKHYDEVSQQN
jgi:hypothetical protein